MGEQATPWRRLAGRGMYPVEYAAWLLSPLRHLIASPTRIADRLLLSPADRVLEIGCGPGFFSPTIAQRLPVGHLTLLDAQEAMLTLASKRMRQRSLTNFICVCGNAERLPFVAEAFDAVLMVTVLGEVCDRPTAMTEVARVLRPRGHLSSTEAAGDPDRMQPAELDRLAAHAGLARGESWQGLLIRTHNYNKRSA